MSKFNPMSYGTFGPGGQFVSPNDYGWRGELARSPRKSLPPAYDEDCGCSSLGHASRMTHLEVDRMVEVLRGVCPMQRATSEQWREKARAVLEVKR